MKPAFVVSAGELDAAGKELKRVVPLDWLRAAFAETDATPVGDGLLDVRLSKSGADVVVYGGAEALVELPCARCLEPARVTLATKISVLMVPASKTRARDEREHEMAAGEADVLPYDGESVVLDDLVRDDLVLEIPMIPLCSDNCPGIASVVQPTKRAIDPRLAPLLALKKEKEQKE